ncbi:MAG: TonB-dependent receptor [Bacteroidales bacterium]|nr:TonB-dependent receptor [Bacteroidales bacterium]
MMLTKRIDGLRQFLACCLMFVCAALTGVSAFAQDRNVSGVVLDETDQGVPGAYVVVKGETRGAMTDEEGRFNISVSPTDVLVASFLGYLDESVTVGDQTKLTIKLVPAANELEEVVKVAYGTQRKASVIGSISTVDMATLAQSQGNLSTSLAGKLAGVVAVQKTGEPGASADFWIRGMSSFGDDGKASKPLILVDGVERSMDMVDTEDIASLSILKDASATALYGVRGANGIVIITTRRGQESKPQINIKVETGVTSPVKLPEMANTGEFIDFLYNMYSDADAGDPFQSLGGYQFAKEAYLTRVDRDLYPSVDWVKEIFKNQAMTTKANVSVSGGNKTVRYFVAGSYYLEDGILNTAANDRYDAQMSYQRFNFRTNVDINVTKSTVLGMNLSTQFTVKNSPRAGLDEILKNTMTLTPIAIPAIYSDGTLAEIVGTPNPYNSLNETGYTNVSSNVAQSTISLTQDFSDFITEGLSARIAFSFDATNTNTLERRIDPKTYIAVGRDPVTNDLQYKDASGAGGYINLYSTPWGQRYINFEGSINYERQFAYAHRVSAMVLYSMRSLSYTHPGSYIAAFPYKSMGVAARATYSYKDRYFVEFNMGYNGSENFAPGHRFGFFPALAVGYMLSNEPWWDGIKNVVNLLKVKASYGMVGNDQIGGSRRFAYNTTINTSAPGAAWGTTPAAGVNYTTEGGITTDEEGNLSVEWEQATKANVGIELGLFNDLTIQADLFRDYRDGIYLRRESIPSAVGLQKTSYVNIGEMLNRGFDMSLDYNHVFASGLSVSARGNFTFNRNRLIYDDKPDQVEKYLNNAGFAYQQRKGLISCGLFKDQADIDSWPDQSEFGSVQPGDIKYKDINGDGAVNKDDMVAIGYTVVPEINYGFGASLGYKGFDVSVFFNGVAHVTRQIGGSNLYGGSNSQIQTGQVFKEVLDNHWSKANPNPNAMYPRLGITMSQNNQATSDFWTRDMSFIRLKNAEIGYSFPKKWIKKAGMSALRIYVSGTNLLTFSKFKLWDPELETAYGTKYPITRNVSVGLNINF